MESQDKVDIIICGGGCSAMLLLYHLHLYQGFNQLQILVIEKELPSMQKTWCFWHKGNHPLQHLITSSWDNVRFTDQQLTISQSIHPYTYSSITGKDFFEYFLNVFLPQFPNIKIIKDEVKNIIKNSESLSKVICNNSVYYSSTVYSSLVEKEFYEAPIFLWQHFKGWHIVTEEDVFEKNTMTLMDFSDSLQNSFDFVYILPYSGNEALIEFTAFSNEIWDDDFYLEILNKHISNKLNGVKYKILSTEKGKIPMAHYNHRALGNSGEIFIGNAAGKIKATSGYGFEKMQLDSARLASNYFKGTISTKSPTKRFKFYDKLLLKIISDEPEKAVSIFGKLFKHTPIRLILKFLYEETNLIEEFLIFKRLPRFPFIKRIFN